MGKTTIIARNLKDALRKARSQFRGNLVVDKVREKERTFEVTTKMRIRHLKKR